MLFDMDAVVIGSNCADEIETYAVEVDEFQIPKDAREALARGVPNVNTNRARPYPVALIAVCPVIAPETVTEGNAKDRYCRSSNLSVISCSLLGKQAVEGFCLQHAAAAIDGGEQGNNTCIHVQIWVALNHHSWAFDHTVEGEVTKDNR